MGLIEEAASPNMNPIEGDSLCRSFDAYNLVDIQHRYVNQATSESEIDNWGELLIEEIKTLEKKDVIILLNVDEHADVDNMIYWCNSLTNRLNKTSLNYIILTNSTFKYADDYDRVISLIWFLHTTVSAYTSGVYRGPRFIDYPDNIETLPWKSTNTSVLFLPGKPWKEMRVPALYYFLRSNLRHNLKYSSMTFEEMMRISLRNFDTPGYDSQLLESWNLVYGTPPGLPPARRTKSYSMNEVRTIMNGLAKVLDRQWNWLNYDYMLHPTMYSDVGVEILAETDHRSEEHITEKTYKPIVLGYPFVYIHSNFIYTLISQGFKVYQPMVPRTYNSWKPRGGSGDWKIKFETCVENTEKVLNNMKDEYMESAIKHNQQHATDLHQEAINDIAKIIPGFEEYADVIFGTHGKRLGNPA